MENTRCKKVWTREEENYLEENWGYISIPTIAQKLGRSVNGIKVRASRLNLGPALLGGDYITLNQLVMAITGHTVDSYMLISWVKNRKLPVHKRKVNNNSFRVVYLDEFWKWAEKNRSFIDFSKMEPLALGVEPDWVAAQRKKDFYSNALQRKDPWSPAEDKKLLRLLEEQKYGYKELSKILQRSEGAIQRRCLGLGTKLRPVKADNHGEDALWSEENFSILAEGIRNGDSYAVISELIGKSEKAVRGKVYFTYLTENADKVRSMLCNGEWGHGAPEPTVRQGASLSRCRTQVKKDLSYLAALLRFRMNQLGYDPYWQRFMCMNWDDFNGCSAGCTDCDSCTEFKRIKPQYCVRCGATFYERKENNLCKDCRVARKKQAQKKWCILNKNK